MVCKKFLLKNQNRLQTAKLIDGNKNRSQKKAPLTKVKSAIQNYLKFIL
jgi:hypothetical protein